MLETMEMKMNHNPEKIIKIWTLDSVVLLLYLPPLDSWDCLQDAPADSFEDYTSLQRLITKQLGKNPKELLETQWFLNGFMLEVRALFTDVNVMSFLSNNINLYRWKHSLNDSTLLTMKIHNKPPKFESLSKFTNNLKIFY